MNEKIKITIFALSSGIFATALLLYSLWQIIKVTIPHMNILGGSKTSLTSDEQKIFYLWAFAAFISIIICPLTAYLLRQLVFTAFTGFFSRFFIFATIACLQIIFIFLFISGWFLLESYSNHVRRKQNEIANRPFNILVEKLDNAGINVVIKKARILKDDGKYIDAEITLQIENVPTIIPYYTFNINEIDGNEGFIAGFSNRQNKSNTVMRVDNENGNWVFKDFFSNQIISENANEIKFQIEIIRESKAKNLLPKTITPRLGISAGKDKIYSRNHNFYYKPLPINFEN